MMFKKFISIVLATCVISFNANAGSNGELILKKNEPSEINDCFEKINRATFAFNQALDGVLFKPVAKVYRVLPSPVKSGVSNSLDNISNLVTIPNNILQGDLSKAGINTGRFVINTTIGILGIIDVATYLLNEKRDLIIQSESENNNKIFIIGNKYFDVPQFKITTSELNDKKSLSYQEIEIPETDIDEDIQQISKEVVEPAVKGLIPEKRTKKNKSLFGFIKGLIASDDDKEDDLPEEAEDPKNTIPKREPQEDFKKPFKNLLKWFFYFNPSIER